MLFLAENREILNLDSCQSRPHNFSSFRRHTSHLFQSFNLMFFRVKKDIKVFLIYTVYHIGIKLARFRLKILELLLSRSQFLFKAFLKIKLKTNALACLIGIKINGQMMELQFYQLIRAKYKVKAKIQDLSWFSLKQVLTSRRMQILTFSMLWVI